jgi:hypothetical protein
LLSICPGFGGLGFEGYRPSDKVDDERIARSPMARGVKRSASHADKAAVAARAWPKARRASCIAEISFASG